MVDFKLSWVEKLSDKDNKIEPTSEE